jgi:hypothetical protein
MLYQGRFAGQDAAQAQNRRRPEDKTIFFRLVFFNKQNSSLYLLSGKHRNKDYIFSPN